MNRSPDRRRSSAPVYALLVLAGLASLSVPLGAAAQQPAPADLSIDQAIRIARENNPTFLQQVNDVGVARSSLRAAYGNFIPSLSASNSYGYTAAGDARYGTVEFGQQPESYSSSYSLNMGLSLSGSTLLQPTVERAQKVATERRVEGAAASLDAQVANQYLTVLQARELVAQAEQELARTEEHVRPRSVWCRPGTMPISRRSRSDSYSAPPWIRRSAFPAPSPSSIPTGRHRSWWRRRLPPTPPFAQ